MLFPRRVRALGPGGPLHHSLSQDHSPSDGGTAVGGHRPRGSRPGRAPWDWDQGLFWARVGRACQERWGDKSADKERNRGAKNKLICVTPARGGRQIVAPNREADYFKGCYFHSLLFWGEDAAPAPASGPRGGLSGSGGDTGTPVRTRCLQGRRHPLGAPCGRQIRGSLCGHENPAFQGRRVEPRTLLPRPGRSPRSPLTPQLLPHHLRASVTGRHPGHPSSLRVHGHVRPELLLVSSSVPSSPATLASASPAPHPRCRD